MVVFRLTNALLLVMAALWWFYNRHNDMAEPIVAIIVGSIAVIEIAGDVVAAEAKTQHESQASMESEVLPDVLDRIEREESNIQQVIDGKRKEDKIIEEYPIELLEPHVQKLRKLNRFSRLAGRLQTELARNKELPKGGKQFEELQVVLREIKVLASRTNTGGKNWFWVFYPVVALCVGVSGVALVRLPLNEETGTQTKSQPETGTEADRSDASQGDI